MPLLVYSFSFGMSRGKIRSAAEVCADCFAPDPGWASVNRGVLICDECCSVHRSLGRHVSQIKSLRKGSWVPTQLAMVHALAASGANHIWEHSLLLDNKMQRRKPSAKDPVHPNKADFIRAKYHNLAFTRRLNSNDAERVNDISRQLHSCVRTDNLETTLRLLSLGSDPNFLHPEKGTAPLHVAAKAGQILQIEVLVVYGADPGGSDVNGDTVVDYARTAGHKDIADRLVELQYELTDRIAFYLCGRKPAHRNGHHFIIPEMADNASDLSELAKAAKRKLTTLANKLFEELAMDVYDEVDRRELDEIWYSGTVNRNTLVSDRSVPFLPVNSQLSAVRNQGRQKLARFNAREFATLIIDILNDARRRQMGVSPGGGSGHSARDDIHSHLLLEGKDIGGGSSTRVPVTFGAPSVTFGAAKVGGRRQSAGSDDEPVYDSVASDEDSLDSSSLPRKSVVVLSSKEGTPATNLDSGGKGEKGNENYYEEADAGSEEETPDDLKSLELLKSRKVFINGDGKAAPPAEAEYEKIEIFSNSVPIEAYLKLKQMLVESDGRIQELLAANQDLKQEVALLQNMVQTLMQENVNLRRAAGGDAAASAAAPSLSQLRVSQFHQALLKENGLAEFYPSPFDAGSAFRSREREENRINNNDEEDDDNAPRKLAGNPLLDSRLSNVTQQLNRTSNALEKVAGNFVFNGTTTHSPPATPSDGTSPSSHRAASRDDSSIRTAPARVTSRSFQVGGGGGASGRGRNRPVSMFEPRLGTTEAVDEPLPSPTNHLGWVNSYSARGDGPAGNVHQDHTASCFQLPTTPEQAEGMQGPRRQTTPISDPRSTTRNGSTRFATGAKNGMGRLLEEDSAEDLALAGAVGPGGTGGGKVAKVTVDSFLPREEDVIRKTEKITKKIQDLLVAAQEGRSNEYAPAADRICYAVSDMRSLFPENPSRENIRSALVLLQASAYRLQAECHEKSMPGNEYPPLEIPHVIQRAYDIAKAAKALVTEFQ